MSSVEFVAPMLNVSDLTQDDLAFMAELLNDYLETFDADEQYFNGIDDPQARYNAAELLHGRLLGIDLSDLGQDQSHQPDTLHHPDCTCHACEWERV
jgi:hypothetical protein